MNVNAALQFEDRFLQLMLFGHSLAYLLFAEGNPIVMLQKLFHTLSIVSSPYQVASQNKCAQFVQIYSNDPRSIISTS